LVGLFGPDVFERRKIRINLIFALDKIAACAGSICVCVHFLFRVKGESFILPNFPACVDPKMAQQPFTESPMKALDYSRPSNAPFAVLDGFPVRALAYLSEAKARTF
jgi:hypothetical protein